MPGSAAIILSVWEGLAEVQRRSHGFATGGLDFEEIDAATERASLRRAQEGAERARHAGLNAEPRARRCDAAIWKTIIEEGDLAGVSAIVLGSRGLTGLKSRLLGSVSHGVLQHSGRPVIVVPSPEVAAKRLAAGR
jgi:nucleotide-binding universal stress UspA family protein